MFQELAQRWGATTPPFFRKLRARLLAAAGSATALLLTVEHLPAWLPAEWLKTVVAACTLAAGVCSLVVDWNVTDPNETPAITPPAAVRLVKDATDLPTGEEPEPLSQPGVHEPGEPDLTY